MEVPLQIDSRLIRELDPILVAVARRSVPRGEDAEDVVQEMWMSALASSASYEGRSSVRTWLQAILRRRIVDRLRRTRPNMPYDDELYAEDAHDVAELAETRELAEHALRMLPELGELERRALALCTLDELDRDRACAELGITRGHLRVLIHRARKKLVALSA